MAGAAVKMMLDLSLSPQSIVLLVPLMAVFSFLIVFAAPWMYGKMSAGFFGGAQMDPRGPDARRYPNRNTNTNQTRYRIDARAGHDSHSHDEGSHGANDSRGHKSSYGSIFGSSYGSGYHSNYNQAKPRNDDYDETQYAFRDLEPPKAEFAEDDSDSDDDNEENEDDSDSD